MPISYTNIEFLVDDKIINGKHWTTIRGKFFIQHARKFKKWNKDSQQNISWQHLT